ncbi:MAG TPA: flagellar biosynthetic protein FliO [Parachlamydiaceae bacterium]|nr:flagellar biosynthetic protein FliO [Parachlamydiaceae bacterium]
MINYYRIYVLLLFLFCVSPNFAENGKEMTIKEENRKIEEEIPLPPSLRQQKKQELPREDNFMKEFLNMLFTLGSIIALLILASWMLKRIANTRIQQMNESSLIKILERRTVSPKLSLYLVDIKGKQIAIAESHSALLLLKDIPQNSEELEESQFKDV